MEWRLELDKAIAERNSLRDRVAASDAVVVGLRTDVHERNLAIADYELRLADLHRQLEARENDLATVLGSLSWRITAPLRSMMFRVRNSRE